MGRISVSSFTVAVPRVTDAPDLLLIPVPSDMLRSSEPESFFTGNTILTTGFILILDFLEFGDAGNIFKSGEHDDNSHIFSIHHRIITGSRLQSGNTSVNPFTHCHKAF